LGKTINPGSLLDAVEDSLFILFLATLKINTVFWVLCIWYRAFTVFMWWWCGVIRYVVTDAPVFSAVLCTCILNCHLLLWLSSCIIRCFQVSTNSTSCPIYA